MRRIVILLLMLWPIVGNASDDAEYFASLRYDKVNWRSGPGERYPIKWIYQEQGYPVKVLDKYDIWLQVQEADGSIGWVRKNMISDRRTVLVQEEDSLMTKPDEKAYTLAIVQQGTIGKVLKCPSGLSYCLLSFMYEDKPVKGWFPRTSVWGIEANEEID